MISYQFILYIMDNDCSHTVVMPQMHALAELCLLFVKYFL